MGRQLFECPDCARRVTMYVIARVYCGACKRDMIPISAALTTSVIATITPAGRAALEADGGSNG